VDHKSWLDPVEFMDTAIEASYKNVSNVDIICNYLISGVKIGYEGEGRLPTFGSNDPSVSNFGYEAAHEILPSNKVGICVGS